MNCVLQNHCILRFLFLIPNQQQLYSIQWKAGIYKKTIVCYNLEELRGTMV